MTFVLLGFSGDEVHNERDRLHSRDWGEREKGLELYEVLYLLA